MPPRIIAENEWLIVLYKPAGLIVHSDGRTVEPSLMEWLLARWPALKGVGEPWISPQGEVIARPGIVHRLDRTTSGVMVVAKTQGAWEYLRGEFKARRVEKTYRALVYGHVKADASRIVAEIDKGGVPKKWFARTHESDTRAAITDWRAIRRFEIEGEPVTYIEAMPRTGRTHQLRVHFAHIGHPLLADHLYAPDRPSLGFGRPMLHSYSISFVVPSGEKDTYTAPLPDDFLRAQTQ